VKIAITYEIGDQITFKAPTGPLKFVEVDGVIDDITLHFDEESDTSNTVYVVNVNGMFYNISYVQIVRVAPDDHAHEFKLICKRCGAWYPSGDDNDD
jgi:uncharacterized protein YbaR (Trm112 family)